MIPLVMVLTSVAPPVGAHNLDTRATNIAFAQDYLGVMSAQASAA